MEVGEMEGFDLYYTKVSEIGFVMINLDLQLDWIERHLRDY